jgi:hypothetical protein
MELQGKERKGEEEREKQNKECYWGYLVAYL